MFLSYNQREHIRSLFEPGGKTLPGGIHELSIWEVQIMEKNNTRFLRIAFKAIKYDAFNQMYIMTKQDKLRLINLMQICFNHTLDVSTIDKISYQVNNFIKKKFNAITGIELIKGKDVIFKNPFIFNATHIDDKSLNNFTNYIQLLRTKK